MKILQFLILLFYLPDIRSQFDSNSNGVVLNYTVNFQNNCRSQTGRFVFLYGFSISQCVEECALRPRCSSLNYRRLEKVCELFSVAEEGDTHMKSCIFMKATDINVLQTPCGLCNDKEACDVSSQKCVIKECQALTDPKNGNVLGNKHEIGAKVKFQCDGFVPNVTEAVCLSNGQWSADADCTKVTDCPSPNGYSKNGFVIIIFTAENVSRETASSRCSTIGGKLVKIDIKWKMDFIDELLKACTAYSIFENYWTDGRGDGVTYRFADNTELPMTPSVFWSSGEPDGYETSRCTRMRYKDGAYLFGDTSCTRQFKYICEL